jgi:hypothetical protein
VRKSSHVILRCATYNFKFGIPFTARVNNCLSSVFANTFRNSSTSQCTHTNLPLMNSASGLHAHTRYEAGSSTMHCQPTAQRDEAWAELTVIQGQLRPSLVIKMLYSLLMHFRHHHARRNIHNPESRILCCETLKYTRCCNLARSVSALAGYDGAHGCAG